MASEKTTTSSQEEQNQQSLKPELTANDKEKLAQKRSEMQLTQLLTRLEALEKAQSALVVPSENTKKSVRDIFSKAVVKKDPHTATNVSPRALFWFLALLAIPAVGIWIFTRPPQQLHNVSDVQVANAQISQLTPQHFITFTPTKEPTVTPTSTYTPSATFTPTETYTPTYTPTITPTPFIAQIWVSIQALYPVKNAQTLSGINWQDVIGTGAGCPDEIPIGAEIVFSDTERYICVDRYNKIAKCDGVYCRIYVFSKQNFTPALRRARIELLSGDIPKVTQLPKP